MKKYYKGLSLSGSRRIKIRKNQMDHTALSYTLALTQIPGIGSVNGKKLIRMLGSARNVFDHYHESKDFNPRLMRLIRQALKDRAIWKRAEDEMKFIEKYRLKVLFFLDPDYPRRLVDCFDSPVYLFYKGSADLNAEKIIGIVGTRSATDYGKSVTRDLISGLRQESPLVVSGLAYGIDSHAHRAALDNGLDTLGVLGHGLDRIYPGNNKAMAEKMLKQGGLLTEFFSCTEPDRENFPQRNRIIAGLCDAIVVVEAAEEGGALITADIAHSYGRDVFAIPGRIGDKYSGGCNMLMKLKKAEVLRNAEDLIYEMGWSVSGKKVPALQPKLFIPLTRDEEKVIELLRAEGDLDIDEISRRSELPVNKVAVALLNLEMENVIQCKPGKLFRVQGLP
ncbi:MAG: DNA-processing protein DprA [Bacteroidetes bacterium]|nr:DNA-processing protein DprA [Bacteroidota bacterium]